MSLPKGMAIVNHKSDIIAALYRTNIAVKHLGDSTVSVNSGGWKTKHTKKCINIFFDKHSIPLYVYQSKFVWYVRNTDTGITVEFIDHMVLDI